MPVLDSSISSKCVSQHWGWNEDNFLQWRKIYHQVTIAERTIRGCTSGSIKLNLEGKSEHQKGVVSKVIGKHMDKSKWAMNVENIINNFGVLRKSETEILDNNYM